MNVFVVDDCAAVRGLMIHRLLGLTAVRVVGEAAGEVDALAMIERLGPDLVLLDFCLAGGGSGFNVLTQLRRSGYRGRILMVSGETTYAEPCLKAGADGFYDKAGGLERLFGELSRLVHGQAGEPAAIKAGASAPRPCGSAAPARCPRTG